MGELFQWLDADPLRYRAGIIVGLTLCAALVWHSARARERGWWATPLMYGAALLFALFLFRWPVVLHNARLGNPDESQIISDAIAYSVDPVPFRSVDPNTAGPLSSLSLLAFSRATFRPLDFVTARLFGLTCLWLLMLSAWRSLAAITTETRARLLTLPVLLVLGAGGVDLYQLNNERPSAAALGLAWWALAPLLNDARQLSRGRLLLGALFIGAAPLFKPQCAPLALALAVLGGIGLWRHAPTRPGFWRALVWYAVGGVAPLALLITSCVVNGLWDDVIRTFVQNNLTYAAGRQFPWHEAWKAVDGLAATAGPPRRAYWAAALALLVGAALWRAFTPPVRWRVFVAAGYFVAAVVTVAAPGKLFQHYIFYLVQPASVFVAVVALAVWEFLERGEAQAGRGKSRVLVAGAVWFAVAALPVPALDWRAVPASYGQWGQREPSAALVREHVAQYSRPGDTLAVWGWAPWVYVWTQLPHAPREGVTQRQIEQWGDFEYYRDRFVDDLRRRRPAVFIDAVGPADFSYDNPALQAHEASGQVARYVATHYVLSETVEGLRVFVRRDRAPREASVKFTVGVEKFEMTTPRPDFWAGETPSVISQPDGTRVLFAHAPCQLAWAPSDQPRRARFVFGLPDDATRGSNQSDGVEFRVFTVDFATGEEKVLFSQLLQPLERQTDRRDHAGNVLVPPGVTVIFETAPGPSRRNSWDWSYWRSISVVLE